MRPPKSSSTFSSIQLQGMLFTLAKSSMVYSSGLNAALAEITKMAAQALNCDRVSIWTYTPDKISIELRDLYEREKNSHSKYLEMKRLDYPIYFESLQNRRVLAAHDVFTSDFTQELLKSYYIPLKIGATIDGSIQFNGELYGVICHERIGEAYQWSADEENFVASLTDLVGRVLEIDARLRLQRSLEQSNADLENKIREIKENERKYAQALRLSAFGEMAAGIAHEINGPLTVIQVRAEQLKDLVNNKSFDLVLASSYIEKILTTSDRIVKIVRGLKILSRKSDQKNFSQVPIALVVKDTLDFCKERFRKKGVNLKVGDICEQLIECHPIQLSQVFLNLLNNAIDAVESLPNPWVLFEVQDKGPNIQILVTDSGTGIPKHIEDKLTEPFFTTKPEGKGTGLGLSISRGIIENHQGTLKLNSQSPNTQFIVEIPRRQIMKKRIEEKN